jgi:hypothetical protein
VKQVHLSTSLWRTLRYVRQHGLRQTVRRLIAWCTHGSEDFIITRVGLTGPPVAERVGDVVLRVATSADLPALLEVEHFSSRAARLRGHVEQGDWIFIACHGERIVAARVVTRAVPPRDLASRVLDLRHDQAWDDDMFCVTDYRGQGLARQLSLFSDRYMGSLGYTEAFARISTSNVPSLRMQRHKGSAFAYHVSYRRFLFYKRLRVSERPPQGLPGSEVIASLQPRV